MRTLIVSFKLAGTLGIEPRCRGSEPRVLPLYDIPIEFGGVSWIRTNDLSLIRRTP